MGNSFTAVSDDVTALYWNPAGMVQLPSVQIGGMLMQLFDGVHYNYFSAVLPTSNYGAFGLAFGQLSADDIIRDDEGNEQGTFNNTDIAFTLGYAFPLYRYLSIGASVQFIHSELYTYSTSSLAADGGIIFAPYSFLSLGATVRHLGTGTRFDNNWDPPPIEISSGLAINIPIWEHNLILASDANVPLSGISKLHTGAEFHYQPPDKLKSNGIYVRAGYESGVYGGDLAAGDYAGLSFGIGYSMYIEGLATIDIDAVDTPFGYLGDAQRISLIIKFGDDGHKRGRRKR